MHGQALRTGLRKGDDVVFRCTNRYTMGERVRTIAQNMHQVVEGIFGHTMAAKDRCVSCTFHVCT